MRGSGDSWPLPAGGLHLSCRTCRHGSRRRIRSIGSVHGPWRSDQVEQSKGRKSMSKTKVFISHAHDEKVLAEALGELIADVLMGAVDVWFSSDTMPGGGIGLGQEWRDPLFERLAGRSL